MKKIIMLVLLIFLSGCSSEYFSKDKTHYSNFKGPTLDYSWNFNKNLDSGGQTYNSTYFELKKYNFIVEISSFIYSYILKTVLDINPAYPIQYKHEEGHIFQNIVLDINNATLYKHKKCYSYRKDSFPNQDFLDRYFYSVTEGSADYYSIFHFNNSYSDDYLLYLKNYNNINNSGEQAHYQGFLFTNYTISKGIYKNLKEFIVDICSLNQMKIFLNFTKN